MIDTQSSVEDNTFYTTNADWLPLAQRRRKSGRILVALGGQPNMDSASTSTSVELLMLEKDGNGLQWIPMLSIKVGRRRFAAFATTTTAKPGILVVGGRDNEHDSLFTMEFLQEPSKDDIVYWSLLNPPPLEKPALATEADTTIHEPTQSEEWIQDLKRQKDGYQNQVLSAILAIRFGVDNPPATPATRQLAIPPEERIKRLRKILDKFLASVNREVNLVRQSARQVRLSGVVAVGKAPDASSVSSLSSQSEETLGRPDLAPDAQGTKKTAKQAQLPYVAPNQRIVPCLSTRKWQWRNPVRVPINDQCRPMLHYSRKSIKTVSKRRCRGATTRRRGNVDVGRWRDASRALVFGPDLDTATIFQFRFIV